MENCHQTSNLYFMIRNYDNTTLNKNESLVNLCENLIDISTNTDVTTKPGGIHLEDCYKPKEGFTKINTLRYHQYLQFINLSGNYLMEVKELGCLYFIKHLDLSHNLLTKLLEFSPPLNLIYVNYSHNLLDSIPDLTNFWTLRYLDLSHNLIKRITGVKNLRYLRHLDMSTNYITMVEELGHMNIHTLLLDFNQINQFDLNPGTNLSTLYKCRNISISNNMLSSLKLFDSVCNLEYINASNNSIHFLSELLHLNNNYNLHIVDLSNNLICQNKLYKQVLLQTVKRLQILDGKQLVTEEMGFLNLDITNNNREKKTYNHNCILNALIDSASYINEEKGEEYNEQSVQIIVLVGPAASRKRAIARTYKKYFPESNISLGISYTTRPKFAQEVEGIDYYFVENNKFNKILEHGRFLTCVQKYGQRFGIRDDELKKGMNGKTVIFSVDLNAALQLRSKFPNCKLLLSMPNSEKVHRQWLVQHFEANSWISTHVHAYVIACKAMYYESAKEVSEKKEFCTSILDEIIKYIERIHEGEPNLGEHLIEDDQEATSSAKKKQLLVTFPNCMEQELITEFVYDYNSLPTHLSLVETLNFTPVLKPLVLKNFKTDQKISLGTNERKNPTNEKQIVSDISWLNVPPLLDTLVPSNRLTAVSSTISETATENEWEHCVSGSSGSNNSNSIGSVSTSKGSSESLHSTNAFSSETSKYFSGLNVAKICLHFFVEEQMRMRQTYKELFATHPGIYFGYIHTEELEESIYIIRDLVIFELAMQRSYKRQRESFQDGQQANRNMLHERTEEICQQIV